MAIVTRTLTLATATALLVTCGPVEPTPVGTPELRGALVDTILARTARREAFSPPKNRALGFEPLAAMAALRDSVVTADTETRLFYALERLSNARRDRHLSVALVPGGLALADSAGLDVWDAPAAPEPLAAPVRFFPDYTDGRSWFVGDVGADVGPDGPRPGNVLTAWNGVPADALEPTLRPWIRHSSMDGLRWKIAEALNLSTAVLPPELRADSLRIEVERADGSPASYTLAYAVPESIEWRGASEPSYPGTSLVRSTPTWELMAPEDGSRHLVVIWYGFRETMVADVDTLVALAEREGLLDHALLLDVTRSRGGSLGPYALQRLQGRPFRTTFGTLRLSDVVPPFVEGKRRDFEAADINDGGVPETIDDGSWLMSWLDGEVTPALQRGDSVTEPVPFKLAHAPAGSNGVLQPTPVHFRGPLVVVSGPNGGSHLDQFVSIVVDNALGRVVGMPAGGYSNTWEWEEVLTFPGTDRPVIGFMWNIGHTITPGGAVLEGNPSPVDDPIPLGAALATDYYAVVYDHVKRLLGTAAPAGAP